MKKSLAIGDRVETPDGVGIIKCQDSCLDGWYSKEMLWLDRWGVLHDTYPAGKPVGMYKDNILYYPTSDLKLERDLL